jgi:hypothetical protein
VIAPPVAVMIVALLLPALELPRKSSVPSPDASPFKLMRCFLLELLVIPAPTKLSVCGALTAILNGTASAAKTSWLSRMFSDREMFLMLETEKVATSPGPFGTVAGVQLAAVFQSLLTGFTLHVALPANDWAAIKHENRQMTGTNLFIARSQQKADENSR